MAAILDKPAAAVCFNVNAAGAIVVEISGTRIQQYRRLGHEPSHPDSWPAARFSCPAQIISSALPWSAVIRAPPAASTALSTRASDRSEPPSMMRARLEIAGVADHRHWRSCSAGLVPAGCGGGDDLDLASRDGCRRAQALTPNAPQVTPCHRIWSSCHSRSRVSGRTSAFRAGELGGQPAGTIHWRYP